jgi:hypothetical protein
VSMSSVRSSSSIRSLTHSFIGLSVDGRDDGFVNEWIDALIY